MDTNRLASLTARHYQITPLDPFGHLFQVSLRIEQPEQPIQTVSLPNWIPGSYLIRDFSKHLIDLRALDDAGNELAIHPIDKSKWSLSSPGAVTLIYQVYAWDLSVRGAHFDQTHAFFNGTSVFLAVDGQRDYPCQLSLNHSEFTRNAQWQAATTMQKQAVNTDGFGFYQASNYHELIDHPFEIGTFQTLEFKACGITHKMVFTGITGEVDFARLEQDLIKICEYELNFFGAPYPIEEYLFQVTVTGSDYGGLEHRSSTALICSRYDLPYPGMEEASDGYVQFLELCSHEYFHTWNVKRIMPEVYQNHPLDTPAFTEQLWWFEGVTSYYDALILLRSGVIDEPTYLKLLGQQMTRVYRMPGRFKQTLAESSFLTWTKFYQQDENAPNAIISYYTKGSLMALALDFLLREGSQNKLSLDTVLLELWHNYGAKQKGLKEGEIQHICQELSGLDLSEFFQMALHKVDDFDFEALFKAFGYQFSLRPAATLSDLGGEASEKVAKFNLGANLVEQNGAVVLKHIWRQGSFADAGLTTNDEIIALNGIKISTKSDIERLMQRTPLGMSWHCHYFRRDELMETTIELQPAIADRVVISKLDEESETLQWL